MRRREFIAGSALLLFTGAAWAQEPARGVFRILWVSTESQPDPFLDGFREGLMQRGYREGGDIVIEQRYAPGNPEGLKALVGELLAMNLDLIVSSGPAMRAMREAKNVPVLFAISGDPVELGIARSIASPGLNFTGATFLSLELAGKRVELLKAAVPGMRRLAVLSNVDHPGEPSEWRATHEAAEAIGVDAIYVPFRGPREFDKALEALRDQAADAMLTFPEGVTMVNRRRLAQFASTNRLPSMFGWREYADAGGLMSYGADQRATHFRLAAYADRILKGEKPADLPIERASKFELIVNLRTARTLGLTVPDSLLARADEVIE
jgi:putative ABC transport system substrate-binding protein